MSRRTDKVKTRAKRRYHKAQVECFKGPMHQDPHVNEQEGGVLPPSTRLQHQGDS